MSRETESTKKDYLERLRGGEELGAGELIRMIFRLSVPAIMAQISVIVMQYIDASMVGRLGAEGSAAIGLVSSSTWLFGGLGMALGMGFTVQCAQQIGAGNEADARNLVRQGMFITFLFSVLLSVIGAAVSGRLPVWIGGDPVICPNSSAYFLIFALFYPIDRIGFLCGGFLQASGNMKTPGLTNVATCFLDVIFNALLIFPGMTLLGMHIPGAGLGVLGAALGTGLAKLCGMLYLLRALYVSSPALHSRKGEKMKLRKNQIVKALKIAAPIAAENAVMNTAQITSTRIVAPLGTAAVAANSLSVTAESLCYMPGYGIASAATSIIGQSIGAGRRETTKKIGWITTFLGMAIMTVSGILMYLAAPYMISFLSPDPQVIALGTKVLRIEAFAEPMFAASIVATGVMRGGGDTLVPAVLNLVCMWLIRIPLALYLAPRIGLEGVWLAMCIELCVRGVLFLIREAQGKYVRKQTA